MSGLSLIIYSRICNFVPILSRYILPHFTMFTVLSLLSYLTVCTSCFVVWLMQVIFICTLLFPFYWTLSFEAKWHYIVLSHRCSNGRQFPANGDSQDFARFSQLCEDAIRFLIQLRLNWLPFDPQMKRGVVLNFLFNNTSSLVRWSRRAYLSLTIILCSPPSLIWYSIKIQLMIGNCLYVLALRLIL